MNEMGATRLTRATDTLLLLLGFEFNEIKECVDPTEIGIKLDGAEDELKYRLGELKDTLVSEYSFRQLSGTRLEPRRNDFIKRVGEITQRIKEREESGDDSAIDESMKAESVGIIATGVLPDNIPVEPAFLLVYAAQADGQILKIKYIKRW